MKRDVFSLAMPHTTDYGSPGGGWPLPRLLKKGIRMLLRRFPDAIVLGSQYFSPCQGLVRGLEIYFDRPNAD